MQDNTMTQRAYCCAALIAMSVISGPLGNTCSAQDYRYAVIPMPTLGGRHSYAWAVNELGVVGAAGFTPGNDFHAMSYDNGQIRDLGTLGGDDSEPRGINSTGWIVGRANPPGGSLFDLRPFLWRNGQMEDLGTLGGDYGEAYDINEQGDVVGYTETIPGQGGNWRAFLWHEGQMTQLAALGGNTIAWDINNQGAIAGRSWSLTFGEYRAVTWENNEIRDLGTLRADGRGRSEAYGVNDSGNVVGLTQTDAYGHAIHAFLWSSGHMYDLGVLQGKKHSFAIAINNLNQVVGWGTIDYPNDDAFIWEQGRGMQRLDQLIAPLADWRLNVAWDINDAGQIVGNGYRLSNRSTTVGFLLTPVHPSMQLTTPSPGTAGASNTITVSGVTPGARVAFVYSLHGGGTRIPGCDLQQNALQLDNPTVIGTAVADANGVASITRNVPLAARGQYVLFQAMVQGECAISQLVVWRFE